MRPLAVLAVLAVVLGTLLPTRSEAGPGSWAVEPTIETVLVSSGLAVLIKDNKKKHKQRSNPYIPPNESGGCPEGWIFVQGRGCRTVPIQKVCSLISPTTGKGGTGMGCGVGQPICEQMANNQLLCCCPDG